MADGINWKVYVHITPSNKYYVGITSQSVRQRWRNGKGYARCTAFNRAIEKYGWDSIYSEVIAENLTEEDAKKFEQTLIEKLNSNNKKFGYNCTYGGDGTLGYRHTEKAKHIVSEKNKGRSRNKGSSNGMYGVLPKTTKKVICITTNEIFESISSASLHIGVNPTTLSKPLAEKGYCRSKGLEWRYLNE